VEDEKTLKEVNENTKKIRISLEKQEKETENDLKYLQSLEAANQVKKQEVWAFITV
jgi:hypothetical protein